MSIGCKHIILILPFTLSVKVTNLTLLNHCYLQVNVPIHIIGGDTALITFTGIGYDKRIMGDTMKMNSQLEPSSVPTVQSVPIPGQLVYLSEERVSFDNMPLFSQSRRVIYVTNHSPNHTVSFEWYVTSATDSQVSYQLSTL